MKTVMIFSAIICLLLGVGCDQKPDLAVADLKERVAELEKKVTDLEDQNIKRVKMDILVNKGISSNSELINKEHAIFEKHLKTQQSINESVDWNILKLGWRITDLEEKPPVPTSSVQKIISTKPVPPEVSAKIIADAAKEFPNDYSLQVTKIKMETEAWHKLNP